MGSKDSSSDGDSGLSCMHDSGCPRSPEECKGGCMAAADELGRLGPELDAEAAQSFDYVATEKAGEAPPRPERRPPYAVAYVVGGLEPYEVLVPGDATVVAEDGTLKITHGEGPVLAIVRTMPVRLQERSAGAAEDE